MTEGGIRHSKIKASACIMRQLCVVHQPPVTPPYRGNFRRGNVLQFCFDDEYCSPLYFCESDKNLS